MMQYNPNFIDDRTTQHVLFLASFTILYCLDDTYCGLVLGKQAS